jgi:type I restriction enzyme S subunit
MMPAGWKAERFADIAVYGAGRTPARANPDYWAGAAGGVPWVAISDMTEFGTVTDTKEKITKAAFERVFRGNAVRAGTLIMSFKLTIGRVASLGIDACHNEAIISIYPKAGVDQRYLSFFLAQVDYDALQDRQVKGNTLNQEKLDRIEVWVPPFEEQASIADVLDLVRLSIEIQDSSFAAARDLKYAAMRALFTRGLKGEAHKETEIGPIPESWQVSTLGELAALDRGRFLHRPRNEPRFYGGSTPFVQTGDVVRSLGRIREHTQTLNDDGVAISRVFPAGTILITIAANIGYTGILQFASACPDSLIAIRPGDRLVPEFLEYWLQTQQSEMDRLAPKGTQKNINIQFLTPWPVVVPPAGEQHEIVAILDAIDRKIDLHRRKRAVLDDLFKALLHKLMTGDLRVTALDLSALAPRPAADTAT